MGLDRLSPLQLMSSLSSSDNPLSHVNDSSCSEHMPLSHSISCPVFCYEDLMGAAAEEVARNPFKVHGVRGPAGVWWSVRAAGGSGREERELAV